jgi:GTP cyclohydrolase I
VAIEYTDAQSARNLVRSIISYIGDDPDREGIIETPKRVVNSWGKLFGGYFQSPEDVLKDFENVGYDQMVVLRDIDFFSMCEHHMLPFFGKVHIGYIPRVNGKIVGVSKLARLVEIFARRLQIQERMTNQIAESINDAIKPVGIMVVIEGQHLCMISRGVEKQNATMVTSAIRGDFDKAEFISLLNM